MFRFVADCLSHASPFNSCHKQVYWKTAMIWQYSSVECSVDCPADVFPCDFLRFRDGVHPAGGAQLEGAGGGKAAAAKKGLLHAGLWLQAGGEQAGWISGTEGETFWRGLSQMKHEWQSSNFRHCFEEMILHQILRVSMLPILAISKTTTSQQRSFTNGVYAQICSWIELTNLSYTNQF